MRFEPVSLNDLLDELQYIPASWRDARADKVISLVGSAVAKLELAGVPDVETLASLLSENPDYLDVIRLFTGDSQDVIAHKLGSEMGITGDYSRVKRFAASHPQRAARALSSLGVPEIIEHHLSRQWGLPDVLIERYRMSRGRAVAGQQRGRALENEVQAILDRLGIEYQARCTFTGQGGRTAKADFAIPGSERPKIVIEVKGFEATGSKQTDVLGDIEKIEAARTRHMYFFVVTDGRGWLNRPSDLRELVRKHREGVIDMIFTRVRMDQLADALQHILTHEM